MHLPLRVSLAMREYTSTTSRWYPLAETAAAVMGELESGVVPSMRRKETPAKDMALGNGKAKLGQLNRIAGTLHSQRPHFVDEVS